MNTERPENDHDAEVGTAPGAEGNAGATDTGTAPDAEAAPKTSPKAPTGTSPEASPAVSPEKRPGAPAGGAEKLRDAERTEGAEGEGDAESEGGTEGAGGTAPSGAPDAPDTTRPAPDASDGTEAEAGESAPPTAGASEDTEAGTPAASASVTLTEAGRAADPADASAQASRPEQSPEAAPSPEVTDAAQADEATATDGTASPAAPVEEPEPAQTPEPSDAPGPAGATGTARTAQGPEDAAPEAAGATGTLGTAQGAEDAGPDASSGPAGSAAPAPLTPRPRRRRPAVLVASVAAAVLLVGGGGAYLASSASQGRADGGTSAGARGDATPPPLRLDGHTGTEDALVGVAPGEPNPYGGSYRAEGKLPEGPGKAAVHRASGTVGADEVARLAKALGVAGEPVLRGEQWRVGADDAGGPTLRVDRQAPGTWTFDRWAARGDDCRKRTVCGSEPAAGGEPVSEAVARKAAAPVLEAVGQKDAVSDARQVLGAQRVVNADPVIDGLPTYGWTTGITVDARGEVVAGSGRLKAPARGHTYPVVSAEKALELLNRKAGAGRGAADCATPVPLNGDGGTPEIACARPAPDAGAALAPSTVEKAVFGLSAQFVDARPALVPSWLFQVRPDGAGEEVAPVTVPYPAVDPAHLAPATPSAQSPTADGGPDRSTSAPAQRDVTVEGYTAEGRELTLRWTGGVCADYEAEVVKEDGKRVVVKVTETPWPDKVCILVAEVFEETVTLDAPLGTRQVVDEDGAAVPPVSPGARLPSPAAR